MANKHMSAEELKLKLFTRFHNDGSMDKFRTQVRHQLMSELFKVAAPNEASKKCCANGDSNKSLLPLQISNWLVHDHLQRHRYDYTLSTFVSESNISYPDKLLTIYDILDLFGLESTSAEYQNIISIFSQNSEHVFLHSLLSTVIKSSFSMQYKNQITKTHCFNDTELQSERLTSPSRNRLLQDHSSCNVQQTDCISCHHKIQFMKEKHEREIQDLQRKLLVELDNFHEQEHKMRMDVEQARSEFVRKQEQFESEIESLKKKHLLMETEHQKEMERKHKEIEEYLSTALRTKERELENWQQRLMMKAETLDKEKELLSNLETRNYSLSGDIKEQQNLYKILHDKYSTLLDNNTKLMKRFEDMSDYSNLKLEIASKSREISNLREEMQQTTQQFEMEKQELSEKVKALQVKLKLLEPKTSKPEGSNPHFEEATWTRQRDKLEQEVIMSRGLYEKIMDRLEEQKEDIHDLHRSLHILHSQVTEKESNSEKNQSIFNQRATIQESFNRSFYDKIRTFTASNRKSQSLINKEPLKFIADARKRISSLQKEADVVREKYSLFLASQPLTNSLNITNQNTHRDYFASGDAQDYHTIKNDNVQQSFVSKSPVNDRTHNVFVATSPKNVMRNFRFRTLSMKDVNQCHDETLKNSKSSENIVHQSHKNVNTANSTVRSKVSPSTSVQPDFTKDLLQSPPNRVSNIDLEIALKSVKSVERTSTFIEPNERTSIEENPSTLIDTTVRTSTPIEPKERTPKFIMPNSKQPLPSIEQINNVLPLAKGALTSVRPNSKTGDPSPSMAEPTIGAVSPSSAMAKPSLGATIDSLVHEQEVPQTSSNTIASVTTARVVLPDNKEQETVATDCENIDQVDGIISDAINTSTIDILINPLSNEVIPEEQTRTESLQGDAGTVSFQVSYNEPVSIPVDLDAAWKQKPTIEKESQNSPVRTLTDIVEGIEETGEKLPDHKQIQLDDSVQVLNSIELEDSKVHKPIKTSDVICEQPNQNMDGESKCKDVSEQRHSPIIEDREKEDSASELSEIKLSCGSEQEQKDDSDFW